MIVIKNQDVPDASVLMANFYECLAAGGGVLFLTFQQAKDYALTVPSRLFIVYAYDVKQILLYTTVTTDGDAGFVPMGGAVPPSTPEVG